MSTRQLAGVLPVFQTPWRHDETLDMATLRGEIEWLYENGADGIVMKAVRATPDALGTAPDAFGAILDAF